MRFIWEFLRTFGLFIWSFAGRESFLIGGAIVAKPISIDPIIKSLQLYCNGSDAVRRRAHLSIVLASDLIDKLRLIQ